MAGVALINAGATTEKLRGPMWWFMDVAVPASGAVMTLATESGNSGWKTPDATENPNAVCVGCSDNMKLTSSVKYDKDFCQQLSSPIGVFPDQTEYMVEIPIVGAINATVLAKAKGTTTSTVSSKEVIEGGSYEVFAAMAIVGVFKMQNDPTKFGYVLFYSCNQVTPFEMPDITKQKFVRQGLKFEALSLSGRAAGKDVFHVCKNI